MTEKRAIARIEVARAGGEPVRGTGALVGERLVLTAMHVVADRKRRPPVFFDGPIRVSFPDREPIAFVPIEGLCDPDADWALLECAEAPGIRPIPLGELQSDDASDQSDQNAEWITYGFPAYKPDGTSLGGQVRDLDGNWEGNRAYQLFTPEAAAGAGAPVAGLSGAPLIVGGAVVGVIRSSPLKEKQNVAGTLYACPIDLVLERAGARLPLPDPCRGLPGLPRRDLPAEPYRYLDYYTEDDAEVFFGRNPEIRRLYDELVAPDGAPMLLFFGQSGVGKSSLLDAGIRPRLLPSHAIKYARRDAAHGLRACLDAATDGDWRKAEARAGRPLVVILDQVEEAYTRPRDDPEVEIKELLDGVEAIFKDPAQRPNGRLLLSLRKEWMPDLRERIKARRLPFTEHFLERLDRAGIVEVVQGITRTKRLRLHYKATLDPELPAQIAGDLVNDFGSPVAPTLQIVMTRLWERARAALSEGGGQAALSVARYKELKDAGIHLKDFLEQQLAALGPGAQPHIESGLVDDVLEAHTTPLGTAETRTADELRFRYAHVGVAALDALLSELQQRYLLTNPVVDKQPDKQRTRLAHDTLAPIVRERFRLSVRRGQRARRILETRAVDWEIEKKGEALDAPDLRLVLAGQAGMRAPTPVEGHVIRVSKRARQMARLTWAGVGLVGLYLVLSLANLYVKNRSQTALGETLSRQTQVDEARQHFEQASGLDDPAEALLEMSRAVELAPEDDPLLGLYIAKTQHLFTEVPPIGGLLSAELVKHADFSDNWDRLLLQEETGAVQVYPIDLSDGERGLQMAAQVKIGVDPKALVGQASLSPDGRWVVTASDKVRIWDASSGSLMLTLSGDWHFPNFDSASDSVVASLPPHRAEGGVMKTSAYIAAVFDGVWKAAPATGDQSIAEASYGFALRRGTCGDHVRTNPHGVKLGRSCSADEKRVATLSPSGRLGATLSLAGATDQRVPLDRGERIIRAHFDRTLEHLAILTTSGRLESWDLKSFRRTWRAAESLGNVNPAEAEAGPEFDGTVPVLVISPDANRVMTATGGTWRLFEIESSAEASRTIPLPAVPGLVAAAFQEKAPELLLLRWRKGGWERSESEAYAWQPGTTPLSVGRHSGFAEILGKRQGPWSGMTAAPELPGFTAGGQYVLFGNGQELWLHRTATGEDIPAIAFADGIGFVVAALALGDAPQLTIKTNGPSNVWIRIELNPPVVINAIPGRTSIGPVEIGARYIIPKREVPAAGPLSLSSAGPWFLAPATPGAHDSDRLPRLRSVLQVDSLKAGTKLLSLPSEHTAVASAFSADGSHVYILYDDGSFHDEFVAAHYEKKPAWVAELGALATSQRIVAGGQVHVVPGMTSGEGRSALIKKIRGAAQAGDAGADYVLRHITGKAL